jgi:hypothetical protein
MITINLFGAPGAGKSTIAAELFAIMKRRGYNIELVTEYAKDLVWAERFNMLEEQAYVFAKQNHRLHRLKNKVDYVITDSPLLLSCIYADISSPIDFPVDEFKAYVIKQSRVYKSINFFVNRNHPYVEQGRMQSAEESDQLSLKIKELLLNLDIDYINVETGDNIANLIYNHLLHTHINKQV